MKFIKSYKIFEMTQKEFHEHRKKLKEDPQYREDFKKKRDDEILNYWRSLKPFEKSDDIPSLLPNPLTEFYKNKLIELGAIAKNKLEDGGWYYGNYRNSDFGKWNSKKQVFDHLRYKFGYRWDTCNHFEDDNGFALFVPLRKANNQELNEISNIEKSI